MVVGSYFTACPIVRTRSSCSLRSSNKYSPKGSHVRGESWGKVWPCGVNLPRYQSIGELQNYYNSARDRIYPRYSETAWNMATKAAASNAAQESAEAEHLRLGTWRTIQDTQKRIQDKQSLSTTKLKNRMQDIDYWRNELVTEIRAVDQEHDKLKDKLRLLEMTREYIQKPLNIADECLLNRERRQGIDEVKDVVERSLNKEVLLVNHCIAQMKQMLERGCVQLKLIRAAQNDLQKDVCNKTQAHTIDNRMHGLCNSSVGIELCEGIELVDNTQSIPISWTKFTQANLARAQKQRALSAQLRGKIDALLQHVNSTVYGQFGAVNNAMQTRIMETMSARDQLRSALKKIMRETYDLEKMGQLLQETIEDKMRPLRVAETRLRERTKRLNVELCFDDPMRALQCEVIELRSAIQTLRDQLRRTQLSLCRLRRNQTVLESDIAIKENSLSIDRKCLSMRKTFPIGGKRGALFSMPVPY